MWQPVQKAAVKMQVVLRMVTPQKTGIKLSQSPSKLVSLMKPAIRLTTFVTGSVRPVQNTAIKMGVRLTKQPDSQKEAVKYQYFLNLNGVYGGVSQTNTGWTTPANALGKHDGANATVTASLTAATGGPLTMTYATLPNKTSLTITKVQLQLYGAQTGALATGNGSYLVEYSINGGSTFTTLIPNNTMNFSNPPAVDITSVINGNWANLQNVQVRVTVNYGVAGTASATLDAVELLVTANLPVTTP